MRIGTHDTDRRVLVIAEVGNNHEGDFARAQELVRQAARSGADGVKFQTYRTECFIRPADRERFARLKSFELTPAQFGLLARLAREEGLLFISTPLDLPSAEVLAGLVDAFKIASGDNTFYPLIERVAAEEKPVIISTGVSGWDEIERAIRSLRTARAGRPLDLALLHCVSSYPAPAEQLNLSAIPWLQQRFEGPVGYSDHALGIDACVAAVALGARIIEKHFTLDKNLSSFRDHQLSADPADLSLLVQQVRACESMRGRPEKAVQPCEESMVAPIRRSVAVQAALPAGHVLAAVDLVWLRPGTGIPPGQEHRVVGRRLRRALGPGELIDPADLD